MSSAPELKATLTLPQTAFPMKANLPQNEPLRLARWAALRLYDELRKAGRGPPCLPAPRRPSLRQRSHPPGPRPQQGPQGFRRQVENHGRLRRSLRSRLSTATACPSKSRSTRSWATRSWRCPLLRCWMHAGPTRRSILTCRPRSSSASAASAAGRALQNHVPRLRGPDPGGLLRLSGKGLRLSRPQAGLLVHPRPHRPGRSRGRVRDAHQPVGLRALRAHLRSGGHRLPRWPAARSTPSSGPPRPGPCPRRWPSPSIPISSTWRWKHPDAGLPHRCRSHCGPRLTRLHRRRGTGRAGGRRLQTRRDH